MSTCKFHFTLDEHRKQRFTSNELHIPANFQQKVLIPATNSEQQARKADFDESRNSNTNKVVFAGNPWKILSNTRVVAFRVRTVCGFHDVQSNDRVRTCSTLFSTAAIFSGLKAPSLFRRGGRLSSIVNAFCSIRKSGESGFLAAWKSNGDEWTCRKGGRSFYARLPGNVLLYLAGGRIARILGTEKGDGMKGKYQRASCLSRGPFNGSAPEKYLPFLSTTLRCHREKCVQVLCIIHLCIVCTYTCVCF